ncbi:DinB family protein [Sediminibacillus halophilus]|uniref:Uncharacterized damage-inducible protein DinB (Forms a four-helix bundle) n=1 Tax=Sediminibacillus halophilus TaxID=482461 RepID=A0A1G9P7D0_9BACI|nr:DinB family protein [Sediminibacillus halophilus]SDL94782.1 Uncharacterized damage-inducible protein DinB (forms a four-helix bundle) [Sediminibacillus halophilus]
METLLKLFDHLKWADQRLMASLTKVDGPDTKGMRLFSHILAAEQVWLARIAGNVSVSNPIWPEMNLEESTQRMKENHSQFEMILENGDVDKLVTYQTSTGKFYTHSLGDILIHLTLHGQHHRGQINQWLREQGIEPVNTDFITFLR